MKPVALDLCCGLGGWTAGLLAEGWDVIGFDIERHEYGDKRYPAQLILKSILELNGYDLRAVNPSLVVASPPCQEFSYMAMPWSRAKQIAGAFRAEVPFPEGYTGSQNVTELTGLFDACFRIAREIGCPIVLENVKGAQPWVGRANAHYGSYYLWGDVGNVGGRVVRADRPARFGEYVRPAVAQKFNPDGTGHGQGSWFAIADSKERGAAQKVPGFNFHQHENGGPGGSFQSAAVAATKVPGISFNGGHAPGFNVTAAQRYREETAQKTVGHVNKRDGFDHNRHLTNQRESDGVKIGGSGDEYWRKPLEAKRREATSVKNGGDGTKVGGAWFGSGNDMSTMRQHNSKSDSRKAASAMIAEIPFPLAQHIAKVFYPR